MISRSSIAWSLFALSPLTFALVACSGDDTNPGGPPSSSPNDAGSSDATAHDAASNVDASSSVDAGTGDASTAVPLPIVLSTGGATLAKPRIVPVIYAGDDSTTKTQILDFLSKIGGSDYWTATAAEYGVGAATVTSPVIVSDSAPTTIDDNDIQPWIAQAIADAAGDGGVDASDDDAGSSPWPQPDGSTIYIVFYPTGTTVTMSNGFGGASQSCTDFGAYHSEVALLDGTSTPYAIIPRCNGYLNLSGLDFVTGAASHELLEAVSDPYTNSAPAFDDTNWDGTGWNVTAGGPEIGDLCKLEATAYFKPTSVGYTVQRTWSNAAASQGHEPCVPDTNAGPYFNAYPDLEPVEAYPSYYVSGIKVEPGDTKTVAVHLFSDGATSGPWTVSAAEYGSAQAPPDPNHSLSFSWDKTAGQAGDVLHLTITRKANGSSTGPGAEAFPVQITSTLGSQSNSWWTVVGE